MLRRERIKLPFSVDYIVSVAAHETGGFKSHLFRKCRNLFGMRPAHKRYDYAKSIENNYNCYKGYRYSIADFIYLIEGYPEIRQGYITGISGLVSAMNRHGYFTASYKQYLSGVSHWYRKLWT